MDIRVEDLRAVLGDSQILRGVELQVGQKELVGVIGPNGSGKSTLLKCIYRVLRPSGGAVYLDGKALEGYSFKQSARRVAVVAQHNYYNFDFSVQDVVLMGRAPHKRALDRDNARDYQMAAQALETVGMSAFAGRSFSTLSGNDQLIVWNLLAGGTGGIAGCANVYPHVMASIYNLFMEGKIEEAKAANASIASFRACFKYGNPNTIVKTAVAMLGYNVGKCRAPFNQVPEEGIKALEKVLKENAEKGMC